MGRKKKSYGPVAWVYGIAIVSAIIFAAYIGYLLYTTRQPEEVEYDAFGIPIPENYQIHGIDVSKYQQQISWDAVKETRHRNVQVGFAFIKATEGVNDIDPYFKKNWDNARQAGIVRGAYHFFVPAKNGKLQVKNFLKMVKLESGDLPPVLDVENSFGLPAPQLRKQVKRWLDTMEKAYGVRPIIYTYVSFYEKYLSGRFDDYPMWVAHYFRAERPRIRRNWTFWQHSDKGKVNGIISPVDFNVFNGDSAAFRALLVP